MPARTFALSLAAGLITAGLAGCGASAGSHHAAATGAADPYGTPAATPAAGAPRPIGPPALITTKRSKLGTIVALGSRHLTLYVFAADRGRASACSGTCAEVWPPVTGVPHAGGAVRGAVLGTIRRGDGLTQITLDGHPLYRFARDRDAGDAYGQGVKSFGAAWYAVHPSGGEADTT